MPKSAFAATCLSLGLSGTRHLQSTFARAGLVPHVVLSAVDTYVIKTYMRESMVVGLIASTAYSADQDGDLARHDLSHLLPWEIVWVGYARGKYLRRFQQQFIDLFDRITGENGIVLDRARDGIVRSARG